MLFVLQKWLVGAVITKEKIDEAAAIFESHLGPGLFNYDGNILARVYGDPKVCVYSDPRVCIYSDPRVCVYGNPRVP